MNVLSALLVVLLGLVFVWFLWPMVVDPIRRFRTERVKSGGDSAGEDLFRQLAERHGPDHDLMRIQRG